MAFPLIHAVVHTNQTNIIVLAVLQNNDTGYKGGT